MEEQDQAPDDVEKQAVSKGLSIKNAFIFLVDWRRLMLVRRSFVSDDGNVSKPMLCVALQAITEIMKKQIIASASDLYGVVAFGTSGEAENAEWPRVRVIQPVERLSAAAIKRLQKITKCAESLGEIEDEDKLNAELVRLQSDKLCCFGDAAPVQFDKALWAARLQLEPLAARAAASSERSLYRLRVVVLTCDEDPTSGSNIAHQQAKTQAKDIIGSMRATIDVMLLSDSASPAEASMVEDEDCKQFFDEIVRGGDDVQREVYSSGKVVRSVLSRDEIVERFQYRNRTKRALCRTTFTLAEGYTFGIACYSTIIKKKRPTKVDLFVETNEPVKRVTTSTCMEIGKTLKPEEIRYTFNLSCLKPIKARGRGAHVVEPEGDELPLFGFTKEELNEMAAIGPRGVTLYGFKPMGCLRRELVIRPSLFIHPDEQSYKGSRALFTQLLHSMLKKNVFAIVLTALRSRSPARFAAMVPQAEELDDRGQQLLAPGFYLLPLPYKDDLRHAWRDELQSSEVKEESNTKQELQNVKEEPNVKEEDVPVNSAVFKPKGTGTARKFIRGLTIKKYHPRMFFNPDLAKFYRALQAEAGVEDDDVEPDESELHPKVEQIDGRQGAALRKFKAETMGEDFDGKYMAERFGTTTGKRSRDAAERAKAKKEAKIESMREAQRNLDMNLFISYYHHGMLDKFKKADLMLYMDAHNLSHSGMRKLDCVIEVERHLKQHLENRGEKGFTNP